MLRTLFSRMLAAYLSVIIIVLIALGFMASSIFHDHYIEKIKSELVREADAICRIVLEEYMDDAKRPVAKEKLFAIVRQYEALLQLCFIDPSLGIRSFYDEKMHQNGRRAKNSMLRPLQKHCFSIQFRIRLCLRPFRRIHNRSNTHGDMSDKHRREYHCRSIDAALRYGRNICIAEQTVH